MDFEIKESYSFDDLVSIMRCLRMPGGCPWDAEQTHESIKKNLIEETYEAVEAINKKDSSLLCEELGDILMQVAFHAQMADEDGEFNIGNVTDGVCKKLIERHPHVFGDVNVSGVDDVLKNWDDIKRKSKGQEKMSDAMGSVPRELPALMRATKIQQKAKKAGFDWQDIAGALDKLSEEIAELKEAIEGGVGERCLDELGDVLFSAVNVSRFLEVDAEEALTSSTDKFISRYRKVESFARARDIDMTAATLEELDKLWDEAKLTD